jgi:Mg2+-importing ATPase
VESLVTQTLIIHIIRTARVPFIESRASWPLIVTTIVVCGAGALIPATLLGETLGFERLPWGYWPCLVGMMLGYATLTHRVEVWHLRRWGM